MGSEGVTQAVQTFQPDFLVISLGVDIYQDDPLSLFGGISRRWHCSTLVSGARRPLRREVRGRSRGCQKFRALAVDAFRDMGETLGQLRLPTLVVQEGGYNASMTGEVLAPGRPPSSPSTPCSPETLTATRTGVLEAGGWLQCVLAFFRGLRSGRRP